MSVKRYKQGYCDVYECESGELMMFEEQQPDAALKEENERMKARVAELEFAARSLRSSQKEYMLNRGNDEIGKSVAEAAKYLDEVLGTSR